jgi:hypothetical protein
MSNEQYQEAERRSPLDKLGSVAGAALAIGAGAAFFYRGGGDKLLSEGARKFGSVLEGVTSDLSQVALNKLDAEQIRNIYRRNVSSPDSVLNTFQDKASLRYTNDNVFGIIRRAYELSNNPRSVLSSMYDEQIISTPLKNDFGRAFGDKHQKIINEFVDTTIKNPDKYYYAQETESYLARKADIAKHFEGTGITSESQEQMLKEITEKMEAKESNMPQFIEDNQVVIDETLAKLLDPDNMRKQFGAEGAKTKVQSARDAFLGDTQVTWNDLLEKREQLRLEGKEIASEFNDTVIATLEKGEVKSKNTFDMMEQLALDHPELRDVYLDPSLRIKDNGDIYSFAETSKVSGAIADEFANTILGKLLKTRDVIQAKKAPNLLYVGAGKSDPILASMETHYKDGKKIDSTITGNRYMRIYDKTYQILDRANKDGNRLNHLPELDNLYLQSGSHGTTPRLIKAMSGDMDHAPISNNAIFRKLDMFSSATPNKFQEGLNFLGKSKQDKWGKNLITDFLYTDTTKLSSDAIEDVDKLVEMNKIYAKATSGLSKETAIKLSNSSLDGRSRRLFGMLSMNDDDLVRTLMNTGKEDGNISLDRIYNSDLSSMLKRHLKNGEKAENTLQIVTNRDLFLSETKTHGYLDLLRREIGKEGFLQHYSANNTGLDGLVDLIETAGIKGNSKKQTKFLMNWAVFQQQTGSFTSKKGLSNLSSLDIIASSTTKARTLFGGRVLQDEYSTSGGFTKQFRQNMKDMAKEHFPLTQKGYAASEQEVVHGHNFGDYMFMRKTVSPLDVVKNLNDTTKLKAFGKQFYAGRKNMKDVTTATLFPYFSLMRLVDPLNEFGIGFSAKSTGSTIDLAKNIMLKRVMPIAGAITAYNYLDYRARDYTGTSITGAFANATAALDLGVRKSIDSMGLSEHTKSNRLANPIAQYIASSDEYQDYEERKKWYADGYSPVRKGRWWSFGSNSELRGGKISFYQPNYLRRANSNWHDVGVYGSSEDKWKHSWIPTPRHPLSTLNALANPYWLENKRYWDRPYPVTGKLFEEGTPWGAVLNPTLGEIIKPVRKMHQNELGGTLTDVRDLIANRNKEIKDKASYVKITQSGEVTPINFTPISGADPSQRVLNIHTGVNGDVSAKYLGEGFDKAATSFNDYEVLSSAYNAQMNNAIGGFAGPFSGTTSGINLNAVKLPKLNELMLEADSGGVVGGIVKKVKATSGVDASAIIAKQNRITLMKASKESELGVVIPEPIFKTTKGMDNDPAADAEALADIRNTPTTKEFLKDAAYSAKQLGGIYGFMSQEMMPSGRKSNVLQGAGRMSSFSRQFWDASVGGAGGEFSEIARRFIPHENHNIEKLNPLRNTLPDWMPDRFRSGDAYQSLPKGEMRLPGAGYETLNKLHPDAYGRYGAFDRMKILADIAPWSPEYKTWRGVAAKTTQDPLLKQEMKDIRKRVSEQSKNHKFFDYRFTNVDLTKKTGVVDKIISDSAFTLIGEDQVYKMAGIKITKDQNGAGLEKYMAPGSKVTVKFGSDEYAKNPDSSVSSIVSIGGENLNKKLVEKKLAETKVDYSPAGAQFMLSDSQLAKGKVLETIAHAPIPFIHSKFMRVETPLESYKREHVYGTPYATWSHPIQGYIKPSFQTAWASGYIPQALGLSTWAIAGVVNRAEHTGRVAKMAANTVFALTNPAAFAGGVLGFGVRMGKSPWMKAGANIGATVGIAGFAATRLDNPILSAANFAVIGGLAAKQLNFSKIGINVGTGKGALIGAAVGISLSAIKNPDLNIDKMFGKYIPKDTKRRWEIEEYYDRLKYIKYTGLYEKAARKALIHEKVNIRKIMNKYDVDVEKREKIKKDLLAYQEKISNTYSERDPRRDAALEDVSQRLNALKYPTQVLKAGEYTKSALAYKHAADSTMYGLKEGATWMNVMRAVPKTDRDYLLEFAKVRDPKRQKEILKYISPYQRRIIQGIWGVEQDKLESNKKFFSTHQLPGGFWDGWKPNVDLDNVEIKTIKNEGMMLGDFGFYESQAQSYEARSAPTIDIFQQQSPLELQRNMITALNGAGLTGVDVNITPTNKPGIQMAANILRTTDYGIKQGINNVFGKLFY